MQARQTPIFACQYLQACQCPYVQGGVGGGPGGCSSTVCWRAGPHPSTAPLHRPDTGTRQLAHCSTCTSLHTCTLLNIIHIVSTYIGEVEDYCSLYLILCHPFQCTVYLHPSGAHSTLPCIDKTGQRLPPIVLCSARLYIRTDCHSTLHPGGKICGYL